MSEYYEKVVLKVVVVLIQNNSEREHLTQWWPVPKTLKQANFDPMSGELLDWSLIRDRITINIPNAYWKIDNVTLQKQCDALEFLDE
jgi:hypothetical protein